MKKYDIFLQNIVQGTCKSADVVVYCIQDIILIKSNVVTGTMMLQQPASVRC